MLASPELRYHKGISVKKYSLTHTSLEVVLSYELAGKVRTIDRKNRILVADKQLWKMMDRTTPVKHN